MPVTVVESVMSGYQTSNPLTVTTTVPAVAGDVGIVVVTVHSGMRTVNSVQGLGGTWVRINAAAGTLNRQEVWRGTGISGTGAVTATLASSGSLGIEVHIIRGVSSTCVVTQSPQYSTSGAETISVSAPAQNGQFALLTAWSNQASAIGSWPAGLGPTTGWTVHPVRASYMTATRVPTETAQTTHTGGWTSTQSASGSAYMIVVGDPAPVGEWGFLDNLNDTSGNGRSGTAINYTPVYVDGPQPNTRGIRFTGANQTVSYGRTGLEPTASDNGVTTMGWVRLLNPVPDANAYYGVLHKTRDGAGSTRAGFQVYQNKFRPMARWRDQLAFIQGAGSTIHDVGGWHHWCVVDGQDRYEFYINGVSVATGTRTDTTTPVSWEAYNWLSGHQGTGDAVSYDGLCVSGLRIFAGQLTTAQVNTWMNTPIASSGGGSSNHTGSGALTGSGTLQAVGTPTFTATGAPGGQGTTQATGTPTLQVTAGTDGTGSLQTDSAPAFEDAASTDGSGTLQAGSAPALEVSANINGGASLTAETGTDTQGEATFAGTGSLQGSGAAQLTTALSLTGSGTLSAQTLATLSGAGGLGGSGDLSAQTSALALTGTAESNGTGNLSSQRLVGLSSAADPSGAGALDAQPLVQFTDAGAITGAGLLEASTTPRSAREVTLSGGGVLQVEVDQLVIVASLALAGSGSSATLDASVSLSQQISLGADGDLAAAPTPSLAAAVLVGGEGTLVARPDRDITLRATTRRTWRGGVPRTTWRAEAPSRSWTARSHK